MDLQKVLTTLKTEEEKIESKIKSLQQEINKATYLLRQQQEVPSILQQAYLQKIGEVGKRIHMRAGPKRKIYLIEVDSDPNWFVVSPYIPPKHPSETRTVNFSDLQAFERTELSDYIEAGGQLPLVYTSIDGIHNPEILMAEDVARIKEDFLEERRALKRRVQRVLTKTEFGKKQTVQAIQSHSAELRTLESDVWRVQNDQVFLHQLPDWKETPVQIQKLSTYLSGSKIYTAAVNQKPVLFVQPEGYEYIRCWRKDRPLEIQNLSEQHAQHHTSADRAKRLLGAKTGDFITTSGHILTESQCKAAQALFNHVRQGVRILPHPEESIEQHIARDSRTREASKSESQYRHWGQTYLSSLNPDATTPGQVMGSGGSYKAFHFGPWTIVEFDETDRATYLFAKDKFDTLRELPRALLRQQRPEGFMGTIIHKQDRDKWTNIVTQYARERN